MRLRHFMTAPRVLAEYLAASSALRFSVTITRLCHQDGGRGPRPGRVLSKFLLTARRSKQSAIKSNDPAVDNNW